jgi:mono/diheme cytochrome c family protein
VRNITKGIPGTQMPAIPLPEADAQAVADFLLSLAARPGEAITGNEASGRALFAGKGRCSECHMFGGNGGTFGPDLSGLRARFQPSALARRMADPVTLTEAAPAAGAPVRGVKKSEGTFTLHLFDRSRRWHFLDKRAMKNAAREAGEPHPVLTASERNDLAAFC